jgi:hypothetical protein
MRPFLSLCPIPALLMIIAGGMAVVSARAENYPLAKALAPHLRPLGLTATADPKGLDQVKSQIIHIISAMESSSKTGGPDGTGLISKAFDFQPAVGSKQRMTMQRNLLQMWQEAKDLGCFNSKQQYTGMITRYSDAGSQAIFEYIVPLEVAPKFSRDISNVRLVAPSRGRFKTSADTARDLAFREQLRSIEQEIEEKKLSISKPTNNLGQTKEEAAKIFQEEMKRAGEAGKETPHIKLNGRLTQQPMKRNGYQWVYSIEMVNTSRHPTEITVEWWLVGDTELKHLNYLMAEGIERVPLRTMGTHQMLLKTKSKAHYDGRADDLDGLAPKDPKRGKTEAKYRGAVIRVVHGKNEIVATWTSDATMARCLTLDPKDEYNLRRMPKLYENPPKQ